MDQGVSEQLKRCYRGRGGGRRRCYCQIHSVPHITWTSSRKLQLRIAFTLLQRHGTRLLSQHYSKPGIKFAQTDPPLMAPVNIMMKSHLLNYLSQNVVVAEWETSDINDPGYEQLSDEDIIQHVRGSESPEEEEEEGEDDNEEQRISHLDAFQSFQVCIDWLHPQSEGEPN